MDFWASQERLRELLALPSPHSRRDKTLNHALAERILAVLPVGRSASVVEIGEKIGANPASVNGTLRRLERIDKVTYLGRGFWERLRE